MWNKQTARRLLRLFSWVVVACAILLACRAAWQESSNWRVARTISEFRASPSQAGADRLARLLSYHTPTPAQGERILTLLLRPEIVTRPAYPAGQLAMISVGRTFHIEMPQDRIELEQQVWTEGREITTGASNTLTKALSGSPKILVGRYLPAKPGTYPTELRITGRIMPARRSALWDRLWARRQGRLGSQGELSSPTTLEPTYECRFTVPFDVNIVEQARAEHLTLVANPQLDEAMRAAISLDTSRSEGFFSNGGQQHRWRGATWITFSRLPVAVGFALSLRMSDGREFPQMPGVAQHLRRRSGDSGKECADAGCFRIEEPGEYTGTLVLRPDPDYAYEDPAIKSIWNGTLEFPISFTVY